MTQMAADEEAKLLAPRVRGAVPSLSDPEVFASLRRSGYYLATLLVALTRIRCSSD